MKKPLIMGILNVTDDSFYEASRVRSIEQAVERALKFVEEGADILDVGGQSTRPGSDEIPEEEEYRRVIPVIEELVKVVPRNVLLSVDTYRANIARKALELGVHIVNDISGLTFDRNMAHVVSEYGAKVVIMHIRGKPKDMQKNPHYDDTISEIKQELIQRIEIAHKHGIKDENIIVDPGIGFGKRLYDNLVILREIDEFKKLGYPVLIGHSRKSFIGRVLNLDDPKDRLEGSLAVATYLALKGVDIIRTHDVKETKMVVDMVHAILNAESFLE